MKTFHWYDKGSYYVNHKRKDIEAMSVVVLFADGRTMHVKPKSISTGFDPYPARRWNIRIEAKNETQQTWEIIGYKLVEAEAEYHFTVLAHDVKPGETLQSLLRLVTVPCDKDEEISYQGIYTFHRGTVSNHLVVE